MFWGEHKKQDYAVESCGADQKSNIFDLFSKISKVLEDFSDDGCPHR
jgi:hypothetical protein